MSSSTSITRLPGPGGQPSRVFRRGDTVLRPAGPWTATVHALLRHLERVGFAGAPRVVGDGYDEQGREVLTFIEGTFVDPHAWSDDQIWHAGRLLRSLHDATAGFRPPLDAVLVSLAVPRRPRRARNGHQPLRRGAVEFRGPRRAAVRAHRLGHRRTHGPARRDSRDRLVERAATRRRHRRATLAATRGGTGGATALLPRRLPADGRRTGRAGHQDDRVRDPRLRGRSGQGMRHP